MKTLAALTLAGLMLAGFSSSASAAVGAIIFVQPTELDFGKVPLKIWVTNAITIENLGDAPLVGKATVAEPFKIISGAEYRVNRQQSHVIRIAYTPTGNQTDKQTMTLTGSGKCSATLLGHLSNQSAPVPKPVTKPAPAKTYSDKFN